MFENLRNDFDTLRSQLSDLDKILDSKSADEIAELEKRIDWNDIEAYLYHNDPEGI